MKLYSVKETAARTDKAPVTIRSIALRYERSGDPIGRRVLGRWGFTAKDIERIKALPAGGAKATERTVIRHRWGPVEEGRRCCKNCEAVQVMGEDGKWSSVPTCK